MYTGKHAHLRPLQPAFIMAATGEAVTYRELERAQQPAGASVPQARPEAARPLFDLHGEQQSLPRSLRRRRTLAGCTYTCVNSYLTAGELAYILDNSESRILDHVDGQARRGARGDQGVPEGRALHRRRRTGESDRIVGLSEATARLARDADRGRMRWHRDALFVRHDRSSQGHPAAAAGAAAWHATAAVRFPRKALAVPRRHDLSVAGAALSLGAAGRGQSHHPDGRHRHHHGEVRSRALSRSWSSNGASPIRQLVPTMFSRMLKLPEDVRKRYDLSSLEIAIHAAAPCPAAGQGAT